MSGSARRFVPHLAALLLVPLFFVAAPAAGQQIEPAPSVQDAAVPATPSALRVPTGTASTFLFPAGPVETLESGAESTLEAVVRPPNSRNTAMMLVGGAAMAVGALVGGDAGTIIMIGGGAVGLVGLWRHLQ